MTSGKRRGSLSAAAALVAAGALLGVVQVLSPVIGTGWVQARGATLRQMSQRACIRRASAVGEAPQLVTETGVEYAKLKDLLEAGDFQGADDETRHLLIQLSGAAAAKRGWVYYTEVRNIPDVDMQTIDNLWQHYSEGKFGFVPQRKVWRQCREQFDKFALEVSWFTDTWQNRNWPDEFVYSLDAPAGHLPLTNCIRGAQVLQEILAHPAYAKKKVATHSTGSSQPRAKADAKRKSALDML